MSGFRGMAVEDRSVPAGATFGVIKGVTTLPPGAVQLSRGQMQDILSKTVDSWMPPKDMYPLKYGGLMQALLAGCSGWVFNDHFRKCFKLRDLHRIVSFAPTIVIPSVSVYLLQRASITNPLLMAELDCPVCAETRSVSLQVLCGYIQPMTLGFAATALIAKNEITTKVPPLTDVGKVAELFRKFCRPVVPSFTFLLALNIAAASYTTYLQGRCALEVRERIFGSMQQEKLPDS